MRTLHVRRFSPRLIWLGLWRDLVLNGLLGTSLVPMGLRWRLYRLYGIDIDKSTIAAGVWIGSKKISIGRGTFINTGCMFSTHSRITIGVDCDLGMRVLIFTGSHEIGGSERRAGQFQSHPVTIGDGAWIGANVSILPGVTIGAGAVIATGAVVAGDCDPNAIYGGVPARKIRDIV